MKWSLILMLPTLLTGSIFAQVYELRTYHAHDGKLDALHARFRDHTVALFEKHGMTNVGYFTPVEDEGRTLVYLLSHPDRAARDAAWRAFFADPDWKAAYKASVEDGKLVKKVESRFLTPTDYSPEPRIETAEPARLFELRTYTTNEGKLPALDARFRDHTVGLFGKHGMTNVLYTHLDEDQDGAGNTLVYLLAHRDAEARKASFDGFRKDKDWQAARDASEKDGPLLVKGGVESVRLVPTDYSPMR